MLNRAHQAMTIDPTKLLIGIARVELSEIDLGAVTNAGITITTTLKERYAGYPAQRMESIPDTVTATAELSVEEVGGVPVVSMLENLFANIVDQTAITYPAVMYAPFAGGGNLKLSADCQILPELTIDFKDDWANLTFKFECVGSNAQTLVRKSNDGGARKPATTVNTTSLSIGKPRVEIDGTSVGAVQSVQISLQGTYKKVESGFPKCTKRIIYLDSQFTIAIVTEEAQLPVSTDAKVVIKQALVNGSHLYFEFKHCNILNDVSISTQNDWTGYASKALPFKGPLDTDVLIKFERRSV